MKTFFKLREAVQIYRIGKEVFYKTIYSSELKAYITNGRDFLLKVSEIEACMNPKGFIQLN
jgi:hypothetical protein